MEVDSGRVLLTPSVTWNEASAEDVLSGIASVGRIGAGLWCEVKPTRESVATYLRWARAAIDEADAATDGDTQSRRAVEAVGHAKRALDRLFDEYLRRDWLHVQMKDRPSFSERLSLLKQRTSGRIPWRLIPPVVGEPRNIAEHDYVSPSVDEAGRAVEAAEVIAAALKTRYLRPSLLGNALGMVVIEQMPEPHGRFAGFGERNDVFVLISEGLDKIVRLGVGRVIDNEHADVMWCRLAAVRQAQHVQLLNWWDSQCSKVWIGEEGLQLKLAASGLRGPSTTSGG